MHGFPEQSIKRLKSHSQIKIEYVSPLEYVREIGYGYSLTAILQYIEGGPSYRIATPLLSIVLHLSPIPRRFQNRSETAYTASKAYKMYMHE